MTLDYLKDLLFDCLNEDDTLNLQDLHWDSATQSFTLVTEDGDTFLLKCEKKNPVFTGPRVLNKT